MADRFFDTSAAAKHYRNESGTARVDAFLAEVGSHHFLSMLSVIELHSVLARLVRTGQINATDFHLARGRFLADIAGGMWQVVPLLDVHYHAAQQMIVRHGLTRGLRTLDALQLAVALSASFGSLDAFVCADANLCAIAMMEWLTTVNPEAP